MNELNIIRTPELIGAEIRTLTTQAQTITLWFGIEIGRRLVEAKELCAHGEWLSFLENQTSFSQPTANRYMRLFTEYGAEQSSLFGAETKYSTLNNLSISNALRLLAIPEEEREEFAVQNDVEHLSTSEVERLVKERTAELEAERQKETLARASAESRMVMLEGELSASAEELEKARGQIAELKAQPVATVTERDEAAIRAAADEAREATKQEFSSILEDTEKALKEQEKQLATAQKERDKALKEAAALRRDMEELKKAEEKAEVPEKTMDKLRAQYEEQIRQAEERAAAAENRLKLAAPAAGEFSTAFTRAQAELNTMHSALAKIEDGELAAKLRTAALAVLEKWTPMFKEGEA